MMHTNYLRVTEGLRILIEILAPYVATKFRNKHNAEWWKWVRDGLSDDQKLDLPPESTNDDNATTAEELMEKLDVARCLTLLLNRYTTDCFQLSRETRAWIHELKNTRNNWAHKGQRDTPTDDASRAIQTIKFLVQWIHDQTTGELRELAQRQIQELDRLLSSWTSIPRRTKPRAPTRARPRRMGTRWLLRLGYWIAARRGDADDQFRLGMMYLESQDYTAAVKWYSRAANKEEKHARARFYLGVMCQRGDGLEQNNTKAVQWYQEAADLGNASAQNNLGMMWFRGDGVPQCNAEAVKWFRKAAEQGNARAHLNLGDMFRTGDGMKKADLREAYAWYNLAAAQEGTERAEAARSDLCSHMTPDQISAAQSLSMQYWKRYVEGPRGQVR